jgi:hypothetical protein
MKKAFGVSLSAILVLFLLAPATYPVEFTLNNAPTQVYFSPDGGCIEAIIKGYPTPKQRSSRPSLFLHFRTHCQGHDRCT